MIECFLQILKELNGRTPFNPQMLCVRFRDDTMFYDRSKGTLVLLILIFDYWTLSLLQHSEKNFPPCNPPFCPPVPFLARRVHHPGLPIQRNCPPLSMSMQWYIIHSPTTFRPHPPLVSSPEELFEYVCDFS